MQEQVGTRLRGGVQQRTRDAGTGRDQAERRDGCSGEWEGTAEDNMGWEGTKGVGGCVG